MLTPNFTTGRLSEPVATDDFGNFAFKVGLLCTFFSDRSLNYYPGDLSCEVVLTQERKC